MCQCGLLSFGKCTTIVLDVDIKNNLGEEYLGTLWTIFATFPQMLNYSKNGKFIKQILCMKIEVQFSKNS